MRKIIDLLCRIGKDKLLHFIVSFLITLVCFVILNRFFMNVYLSIICSGLVTLAVGAAKEVYDKEGDIKDFMADAIGFIVAAIFCFLL